MSATISNPPNGASPQQARLIKALTRVLDTLDKSEERLSDHFSPQRRHARNDVRLPVEVRIPVAGALPIVVEAWMRNVSPGGLSFITQSQIEGKSILVGLKMDGVHESWFNAEVMRAREVVDGFWEYGVAFRGKLQ